MWRVKEGDSRRWKEASGWGPEVCEIGGSQQGNWRWGDRIQVSWKEERRKLRQKPETLSREDGG